MADAAAVVIYQSPGGKRDRDLDAIKKLTELAALSRTIWNGK